MLQVETAQEIGGIRARMLLDAPEEIEKYHWGPLADRALPACRRPG